MKRLITVLIALLVMIQFECAQCGFDEYSEWVVILVFPSMDLISRQGKFITNLDIQLDTFTSVPVNTSLSSFQHLNWTYYMTTYENSPPFEGQIVTSLHMYFLQPVTEDAPDEIAAEFLRAFNHTSLKNPQVENYNNMTEFRYDFGHLPDTPETMKAFLSFRPENEGFSSLIDKVAEFYVHRTSEKQMHAYYILSKTESGYNWKLLIRAYYEESMDLKNVPITRIVEIDNILNDAPIIGGRAKAAVAVGLVENWMIADQIYTQKVKSTNPEPTFFYTEEERNYYVWELDNNQTLENATITVEIDTKDAEPTNNYPISISTEALIAGIVAALILTCFLSWSWMKRRKLKKATFSDGKLISKIRLAASKQASLLMHFNNSGELFLVASLL